MEAHFSFMNTLDLQYIHEVIDALNTIHGEWYDSNPGTRIMKVQICNDVGEQLGLVFYSNVVQEYVFVPDMTGDGIDEEKLAW